MKKFTMIGLVIILLAFSAIPVLAAGPNHGHGNGVSAGQSSNGGNRNQNRNQGSNNDRDNRVSVTAERGKNGQNSHRMRTPFYLQGMITKIDTATMTVTVQVVHGNAQVKQFIGVDLPIKFSATTMIFKITQGDETEGTASSAPSTSPTDDETPPNRVAIPFTDLKVGDVVAIHGNVVGGVYDATLATVYVKVATGQPEVGEP